MNGFRIDTRSIQPCVHTPGAWVLASLLMAVCAAMGPLSQWRFIVEETTAANAGTTTLNVRCEFSATSKISKAKPGESNKAPVTRHISTLNLNAQTPASISLNSLPVQAPWPQALDTVEAFKSSVLEGVDTLAPPGSLKFVTCSPASSLLLAVPVTRGPPA